MKIAYLTAGAAGMYCGSCLHDNALAKALIRMGHDCLLVPTYTPIRTDDDDVSIDQVFMGGINVYLQQKLPWLAFTPRWLDGFLNQAWVINPLTKNAGKTSPKLLGALTVSMLQGVHGRQRKEFGRLLDWLDSEVKPDVLVFTNLLIGGSIPEVKRRSSARVFVTLQGDDIFLDSLPKAVRMRAIELMQKLVPFVDGFLVHSQDYALRMSGLLSIPVGRIHVIPLGIDVTDFGMQTSGEELANAQDARQVEESSKKSFTIGYLARMAPEKGLQRLVDAFVAVAKNPELQHVHLKMAGWMGPQHSEFWSTQKNKLTEAGLDGRWKYEGAVDRHEKARFLDSLDLFCVPTNYTEPKGLFLLEAIASGVPYLQPSHGAFPEIHKRVQAISEDETIGELFEADSQRDLEEKLFGAIRRDRRKGKASDAILNEISIEKHAERFLEIVSA